MPLPAHLTRAAAEALDARDPLAPKRAAFELPAGVIYLDGNSLGALPKGVAARVAHTLREEWGNSLITSWNKHGWFALPGKIGDRLASLVGAPAGSVVACDTISANLFKLIAGALALRPGRRVILSDSGNFPTDLYMAQGLVELLGKHELKVVAPEALQESIDEKVALVMVTEVDYRTGRRHDMTAITATAHNKGALILWDLAHSAGALPVDLTGAGADFAVGCCYKYLNGGPGAPAFLYIHPSLQEAMRTPLSGWWGHSAPFAFDLDYRPAAGITRQLCGTQPILSLAALDEALKVWEGVDLVALAAKSQALQKVFIERVEAGAPSLTLAGPRDFAQRGSQVSFHCAEGYAVMQALVARGVIGDFRAPDIIRFGFAPLYNSFVEAHDAAALLVEVLDQDLWDRPEYKKRAAVT